MSDRGNGWLVVFFVLLCLPWMFSHDEPVKVVVLQAPIEAPKSPTIEDKMAAAGIQCPTCPDIPEGLDRIRKTVLLEGPTISTPTKKYLDFLAGRCEEKRWREIWRRDCKAALAQLELARDTNETWVNPIYGHPPFTEGQVRFLRWSSDWIEQHLAGFEYNWVGTKKDRYLREQRKI